MHIFWFLLAFVSGLASIYPFYIGIKKLQPWYAEIFVGGDAYNYIISACQGTGYIVLAGICILAMIGFIIIGHLHKISGQTEPPSKESDNAASPSLPPQKGM